MSKDGGEERGHGTLAAPTCHPQGSQPRRRPQPRRPFCRLGNREREVEEVVVEEEVCGGRRCGPLVAGVVACLDAGGQQAWKAEVRTEGSRRVWKGVGGFSEYIGGRADLDGSCGDSAAIQGIQRRIESTESELAPKNPDMGNLGR